MAIEPILTESHDRIGWITLNRPEDMNTFNVPFAEGLNRALEDFDRDEEIRVVVIRAAGRRFSVGISLPELQGRTPKEFREFLSLMDRFYHTIPDMKKPVIASVQGPALANGAGIVLACDFAIAADNVKIGTTAINVGLICLGPAVPLARHVGRKKALEMILTGDLISADEAERLGLVNRIVPPDQLEEATLEFAGKLVRKSPLALQIGKIGLTRMADIPYHQALDYMDELFASLCATDDAQEGIAAFQDRRPPVWKLR
jgi:enoyl-CoA hydratase/carnithine racemase